MGCGSGNDGWCAYGAKGRSPVHGVLPADPVISQEWDAAPQRDPSGGAYVLGNIDSQDTGRWPRAGAEYARHDGLVRHGQGGRFVGETGP